MQTPKFNLTLTDGKDKQKIRLDVQLPGKRSSVAYQHLHNLMGLGTNTFVLLPARELRHALRHLHTC